MSPGTATPFMIPGRRALIPPVRTPITPVGYRSPQPRTTCWSLAGTTTLGPDQILPGLEHLVHLPVVPGAVLGDEPGFLDDAVLHLLELQRRGDDAPLRGTEHVEYRGDRWLRNLVRGWQRQLDGGRRQRLRDSLRDQSWAVVQCDRDHPGHDVRHVRERHACRRVPVGQRELSVPQPQAALTFDYDNGVGWGQPETLGDFQLFNSWLTASQVAQLYNGQAATFNGGLSSTTPVKLASGATFDLNGFSQTVDSLADVVGSGGTVTTSVTGGVVLSLATNRHDDL